MTESGSTAPSNAPGLYRLLGPGLGTTPDPSSRIHVYLQEFSEILNLFGQYFNEFSQTQDPSVFEPLVLHFNSNTTAVVAIRMNAPNSSSSPTFSTKEFFATNFCQSADCPPPDPTSWLQWRSVGIPDAMQAIWTFLCQHIPKGDLETMTIISSDGYVIFSIHGTAAIFTPQQAVSASAGSVWQLSSDGSTITQCSVQRPIEDAEIISCFCQLFQHHSSTVEVEKKPKQKAKKARSAIVSKRTIASAPKKSSRTKPQVHFVDDNDIDIHTASADQSEQLDVINDDDADMTDMTGTTDPSHALTEDMDADTPKSHYSFIVFNGAVLASQRRCNPSGHSCVNIFPRETSKP